MKRRDALAGADVVGCGDDGRRNGARPRTRNRGTRWWPPRRRKACSSGRSSAPRVRRRSGRPRSSSSSTASRSSWRPAAPATSRRAGTPSARPARPASTFAPPAVRRTGAWLPASLDQPFGTLPAAVEPGVPWILDPLVDVKAGNGHTLMTSAGGYYILVNNKICPPAWRPAQLQGPRGPEVQGPHRALRADRSVAGIALGRLRLEGLRRRSPAQGDRQREGADAGRDRGAQADRPRRVRHLHPSHAGRRGGHLEAAQAPPVPARRSRRRGDAALRRHEPAEGCARIPTPPACS